MIEEFNRLHWSVRLVFLTLITMAFAVYGFSRMVHTGWAVVMKFSGNASLPLVENLCLLRESD
jgi:hypothetical protein